jgi:uncharacterized protein (DUF2236 family)
MASRDGYFAPESVIRRVGNSVLVPLLGGGAAVLLQVAHPLVAAGIAEHSGYDRDVWRRFLHTVGALYLVVYGTKAEADRVGAAVQALHRSVEGQLVEQLGPFPAGTRYAASDPELMLWVHATLIEASLAASNRLMRPLSADEAERYYREMALVARIFGLQAAALPPTLRAFGDYMRTQLAGPHITVTEPGRRIAAVILRAPLPPPLHMIRPAHRLATAALLPPRLRAEYGLSWGPGRAAALTLAARSTRAVAAPLFIAAERFSPGRGAFAD